jgi:predicted acetyltransferase
MMLELRAPSTDLLPGFIDALERGYHPSTSGAAAYAEKQLGLAKSDPDGFLKKLTHPEEDTLIELPDGKMVPRIPGFVRWMWDGNFCGQISLRWQAGTNDLPSHVLGHIGYSVVEWKRRRGYATKALGLMFPHAKSVGLDYLEITTDVDNIASQKVIEGRGGQLIEKFDMPYSGVPGDGLRYRILLGG